MTVRRNSCLTPFTERELQLIRMWVAQGMATKEAAWELHISTATANTHRSNIMRKLRNLMKVSEFQGLSIVDLVLYSVVNELVDLTAIQQKYTRDAIPSPS
jgi:DNA-binding CsgD family transcriptional regulator